MTPDLNWYWIMNVGLGVLLGHALLVVAAVALYFAVRRIHRRRRGGSRLGLLLIAAAAFGLGLVAVTAVSSLFGSGEATIPVATDPARMEKARVDPTPGLLERIQLGRVRPTQVRIGTAPSEAGKQRVAAYCTPVPVGHLVQTSANPGLVGAALTLAGSVPDSTEKRGTGSRILPDLSGRVNGNKVFLASTLSDGTPWDAKFKVRGRWTFVSDGDSLNVRSERFWSRVFRGALRCGAIAGVGAGIGVLADSSPQRGAARGAALAGGTCVALEVAF